MDFCLATVLNAIKGGLYEAISDEDLANLLISDIVSKLNLKSRINDVYYMEKRYISKLMNKKVNVPSVLRKSLSEEAASVDNLEKHFMKTLVPKLIPERIDGLCARLIECYSNYEESADDVLLELKACYKEKNPARVLAYIFRLSLTVPNKFDSTKTEKQTPASGIDRRRPIKDIEVLDDNNIRCLQAILEAYSSTSGNIATQFHIEDYPQYKDHFQRQKEAYFAAEAVRHASRDSFLNEEDPFEDLLDESYDGVIEAWDKKYPNGFERMETVLSQAVQISMESNLISRETSWVTVRVKKGLCHILVNEGRIESWVYDENL